MDDFLCLADLEAAARRRLPKAIFGFIEGAAEEYWTVNANRAALSARGLRSRVLRDVSRRNVATEIFGRPYAMPVGIAPMGSCCLSWKEGDLEMARAAAAASVPYILSAASSTPLEKIMEAAPHAWYQSYLPPDDAVVDPMLARLTAAGVETLVMTLDIQVMGNRENNVRNGFTTPLRPSVKLFVDGVLHPRWVFGVLGRTLLSAGLPHYENMTAQRGGNLLARSKGRDTQRPMAAMTWTDVARMRDKWNGKLVLKGVLHEDDAAQAYATGVDGLIVSNHGGRQLDGAPPTLAVLPSVVRAAGNIPVMVDGGFRRGTDVLKAVALGAKAVFVGRPMLYGLAVAGQAGVARALEIVRSELDRDLALLGCPDIAQVTEEFLF